VRQIGCTHSIPETNSTNYYWSALFFSVRYSVFGQFLVRYCDIGTPLTPSKLVIEAIYSVHLREIWPLNIRWPRKTYKLFYRQFLRNYLKRKILSASRTSGISSVKIYLVNPAVVWEWIISFSRQAIFLYITY